MTRPLETWAGIECTVNRVGDRWFDQVERTGHASRLDDLECLRDMGARTIRYPVLWERTERERGQFDFQWADTRLDRLRRLGLDPIIGLVHHGSGPRWTNILDPAFGPGLARFAEAVARRYPWVTAYTPVNEPVTTARFSALYGLWHPHLRDLGAFYRAVVQQISATALAMRAIRRVQKDARLIQTEDAGTVFASRSLGYQAKFENVRRWLSFDLLTGAVVRGHPLYSELVRHGVARAELDSLADDPTAPAIVGLNYYVTSDRFLDEHVHIYPSRVHGNNGRHAYADVEAVRVHGQALVGHGGVLLQAWKRYGIPVALTEVHLGCTVDEQVAWLAEAHRGALEARHAGADVRALTIWAAFGSYDWSNLLTREEGRYEPGPFDVSQGRPLATELFEAARNLATKGSPGPVRARPGWWRRKDRLIYRCEPCLSGVHTVAEDSA